MMTTRSAHESSQKYNENNNADTILSARLYEYQKPLVIDKIPKPTVTRGEQVLVKVGGAGLCHSDLHLINGEWKDVIPLHLPQTPGHEVSGWVEEIGESVPQGVLNEGDLVVVFGGWGCGICVHCKDGDEQLCNLGAWPGLSSFDGGFSEYILIPSYRFLIKVEKKYDLNPEELAPLTDAGLTPYRAIKKVRHLLEPGTSIAIVGIGGLGSYGIQYPKILAPNSTTIAIDRSDKKLQLAQKFGADYIINSMTCQDIKSEVFRITEGVGVRAVIDCVGTEETIKDSVRILSKRGVLVVVGLFGNQIKMPLVPSVINEYQTQCSLWGNYNELREVIELAKKRKINHSIHKFSLSDVNKAIELLRSGQVDGRAVIVPQ
jgi:propanol-preferring alcohol dehydrogenase